MILRRPPSCRALPSPFNVKGKSVRPVCWPERLHAVSPCRARYTTGSASLMHSLAKERSTRVGLYLTCSFSRICRLSNCPTGIWMLLKHSGSHTPLDARGASASPQYQHMAPAITIALVRLRHASQDQCTLFGQGRTGLFHLDP